MISVPVLLYTCHMYEDIFKQIGLDEKEAAVYTALLELGPATVGQLMKKTPYKRGDLYNIVYSLRDKKLVSEKVSKGVTIFTLEEPESIKDLIIAEKERVARIQEGFDAIFPDLKSRYNLSVQKPGVRFYEGEDGIQIVAEDSLTAKGMIYSYIDNEAVNKAVPNLNLGYVKKRKALGIFKRMLALDSAYVRSRKDTYDREVTDIRLIPIKESFATVMQVYNNKVSYITLEQGRMIGVIIEDPFIAKMHKLLFELTWDRATRLFEGAPGGVV